MKNRVSVSLTTISVVLLASALWSGPVNAECLVCKDNPEVGFFMCQDTRNEKGWTTGHDRCQEQWRGCSIPVGAVKCTHPGVTSDCERGDKCEENQDTTFHDWY